VGWGDQRPRSTHHLLCDVVRPCLVVIVCNACGFCNCVLHLACRTVARRRAVDGACLLDSRWLSFFRCSHRQRLQALAVRTAVFGL
jgi:hypothetical protein